MKIPTGVLIFWMLAAASAVADPTGAASDFNPSLNASQLTQFADLTGSQVSGDTVVRFGDRSVSNGYQFRRIYRYRHP